MFNQILLRLCPQLRKSVCLALSKMWSDSELHYAMLEKACEDGDTTMAECLIELGADINRKTKTESLIYQVTIYKYIHILYDIVFTLGSFSSVLHSETFMCR